MAKPLSPRVILERVLWIAREARPFTRCDSYVGPDRRFRFVGPPIDMEGRRQDDCNDLVPHGAPLAGRALETSGAA